MDRLLGQLGQEQAPDADLWPAIESEIEAGIAGTSLLDRLPAAIEPADATWSAIESAIRAEQQASAPEGTPKGTFGDWKFPLLAASFVVAVIAGSLLLQFNRPADTTGIEQGPAATVSETPGAADFFLPVATSPSAIAAAAVYRENLALVREQRLRIEESLEMYPTDSNLREVWRRTYEVELHLIDAAGQTLTTI